ncbi:hypothetical protein [Zhihengliuella halotolerans]|uniref:Uncharacterized protein n=1 Tax=Zhihengliuella halotolerans TaxID=370736 RepID=A0A4Q8AHP4_9MICC|nr:hypothetical protein [Zhihengliuella halotolerans]RZU63303.1 hypothetical protein EV380_2918 [Zhihengliuella halotolerans]
MQPAQDLDAEATLSDPPRTFEAAVKNWSTLLSVLVPTPAGAVLAAELLEELCAACADRFACRE